MIKLLLATLVAASANDLGTFWRNRQGLGQLARKENFRAYQTFTRALGEDPLSLPLQLNLGTTFDLNEEWDKAADLYRGVLASLPPDAPQRFDVLFNLGNALGRAKKIPEALKAYQDALEIKPDSVEVKTNIEFLFAGGGGDGKGQSNSQEKDEQKKDEKDSRDNQQKREDALKDPPEKDGKDQKPRPFQSRELSPEDVKRILDEIKNQEQSIRAEEYDKKPKDGARNGKDW